MRITESSLKLEETIIILEVFAESLKDGLDVQYTLRRLELIFSKKNKAHIIEDIRKGILDTGSIAQGFAKILPPNFIEAITSGEKMGHLDKIFEEIKAVYQLRQKTSEKIIKSLSYPAFSIALLVCLFIAMLLVFVPLLEPIIKAAPGGKVPAILEAQISLSHTLRNNLVLFGFFAALSIISMVYVGKKHYSVLFKLPLVKNIMILQENITTFMLTAIFYASGVSIKRIFEMMESTLIGPLQNVFGRAKLELMAGASLTESFEKAGADEDMVIYISAGEAVQKIEEAFKKLAVIENKKLEKNLNILTATVKYVLIVLVGVAVVGFFSMTVVPIYDMMMA